LIIDSRSCGISRSLLEEESITHVKVVAGTYPDETLILPNTYLNFDSVVDPAATGLPSLKVWGSGDQHEMTFTCEDAGISGAKY